MSYGPYCVLPKFGEVVRAQTDFEVMHLQNSVDCDSSFPPYWAIIEVKPPKNTLQIYIIKKCKIIGFTKVFIAHTVYFTVYYLIEIILKHPCKCMELIFPIKVSEI